MKLKSYNILTLFLLIFLLFNWSNANPKTGQTIIEGAKGKKIDNLMSAYEQAGILSGTILVAEKGKVIYKRSFGYAHAEFKVSNAADTKFRIASVSKSVVAILVMKFIEQGKISLDARVSDYLPNFRKDGNKITVRHLLSHTSGLPGGMGNLDGREMRDPVSREELMKPSAENPLEFEPGTKMRYGGASYVVLAMIVEKITGKPYGEVLREMIFEPLGMRDTGIEDAAGTVEMPPNARMRVKNPSPVIERLATGYVKTPTGYIRAPYMDMSRANVSAAMHSTVEDLFRLDRAVSDDKFFSKQSRELMFAPVLEDTALGWNVRNVAFEDLQKPLLRIFPEDPLRSAPADLKMIYKGGDLWGFTSFWTLLPEEDHTIIILLNGGNIYFNTNAVRITQGIINILYDQPYSTPGKHSKTKS
ncbi:MAG TPA: serine hydrolase domain-containing protein [Pyrinomonadaceae bacterium]